MKTSLLQRSRAPICAVLLTVLLGACATAPPAPVELTEDKALEAEVVAVDVSQKMVTLRGPAGDDVTIRVPGARNLAQVEPGDILKVIYSATYRASLAEPGRSDSGAVLSAGRAPEGAAPGGFVAAEAATTVEVISVSEDGGSVSVRDEEGVLQSMDVRREEGRAFARKLKRGDMVLLEYAEAVAIDLQKSGVSEQP